MKKTLSIFTLSMGLSIILAASISWAALRDEKSASSSGESMGQADPNRAIESEPATDPEEMLKSEGEAVAPKKADKAEKRRIERADAFVAGADWEFDGFVAGGQDQNVRTMFYQGDLVYLNIGGEQGINSGDRVTLYKRGDRIRDPQTGRFIGYEVRRAAYARVSDRVEGDTASVRITNTFEPVEIGDLVRRE